MEARQPQGRGQQLLTAPCTRTAGRTIEGLFPQIPEAGRSPHPLPPQIPPQQGRLIGSRILAEGKPSCNQAPGNTFPTSKNASLLSSQQTLPMPFLTPPGPAPGNRSGLRAGVVAHMIRPCLLLRCPFPSTRHSRTYVCLTHRRHPADAR